MRRLVVTLFVVLFVLYLITYFWARHFMPGLFPAR